MSRGRTVAGLGQALTLFRVGAVGGLSDGELVERFASGRGEAGDLAFAAIVERHGPMVLRVCKAILADPHEAQDAYQAAFLILSRKAAGLRVDDSVGPWLHGVAYRVAARARSASALRRSHEARHALATAGRRSDPAPVDDLGPILHEEVGRLPERYRVAVVLCYLEGLTHEQAAARLQWPVGTVRSRLSRGRERLRSRLVRRGVAPAVGIFGALSAPEVVAARFAPGTFPARVAAWADGEIKAMTLTKLKAGLLALGVAAVGAGMLAATATTSGPREQQGAAVPSARRPGDAEAIQGRWTVVDLRQVNHDQTEDEKKFYKSGGMTLTITADRIIHDIDKSEVAYTLDPSKSPAEMTLEATGNRGGRGDDGDGDGRDLATRLHRMFFSDRGRKAPAIYQLKGDDLMICQGRKGDPGPPRAFSVDQIRPDAPFPTLFVLKRSASMPDAVKNRLELDVRVVRAKADLAQARVQLESARASVEAAEAGLKAAEAEWNRADDAPPR